MGYVVVMFYVWFNGGKGYGWFFKVFWIWNEFLVRIVVICVMVKDIIFYIGDCKIGIIFI